MILRCVARVDGFSAGARISPRRLLEFGLVVDYHNTL